MLQSKAAMYGVLAVVEVARQQAAGAAGVQAHEIAKRFSLPVAYCAKVMSQLARAGVFKSGRGPRGGFKLGKSPDNITLLDIVRVVHGQFAPRTSVRRLVTSERTARTISKAMDKAFRVLCDELDSVTVTDLVKAS